MRTTVLAALVLAAAPAARAQDVLIATTPYSPTPVVRPLGSFAPAAPAATPPYSYYAAYPYPARGYVTPVANDAFPFYGQPYGRPYDPWTYHYLGGYLQNRTQFYYPPLR